MKRTRCEGVIDYNRCKKSFRSRVPHSLCRECFRRTYGSKRPIESRELSENKYRRTRNRRTTSTKSVPKVIVNRNNRKNQNAIS